MKNFSRQRTLVLETLLKHRDHPTADDLYREVKEDLPQISLGTVYRNLKKLAENGVISRISVPDSPDRYDPHTGMHPHFICTGCGTVEDLPDDITVPEIRGDSGWFKGREIHGSVFQLYGLCRKCGK
jgi:Fur family peroxide stress response transcriptional regulator